MAVEINFLTYTRNRKSAREREREASWRCGKCKRVGVLGIHMYLCAYWLFINYYQANVKIH